LNRGVISLILGVFAFYLSWLGVGFIIGIPGLIVGINALQSSGKISPKPKSLRKENKFITYAAIALNTFSIIMLLSTLFLEIRPYILK